MKRIVIILLTFFAHCAIDVVVAKPGFDRLPELTLNSILYRHEAHKEYHIKNGIDFVHQQIQKTSQLNRNVAKNSILFLGDGMSVPTLSATRVYIGGEEKSLTFEKFPYVAMSKTYCVNKQVPDSACTATGNYSLMPIYRSILNCNYANYNMNLHFSFSFSSHSSHSTLSICTFFTLLYFFQFFLLFLDFLLFFDFFSLFLHLTLIFQLFHNFLFACAIFIVSNSIFIRS